MRGGDVFLASLMAHGVRAIFGNPGTTENTVLDRLIDFPDINYYVALHEGVAVGAAAFHAQATGQAAVANLHVAPGLGNAIGMIYGALKANAPVVVTAGQQDTRMRLHDPVLAHDLVAMAAPVTKFSAEPNSADELAPLLRRAFKIAMEVPRGPVFIGLPVNIMEQQTDVPASAAPTFSAPQADPQSVAEAVTAITVSRKPCIIVGDDPARDGAFDDVVALSEMIAAPVYNEGLRAQLSFPTRHPNYRGRIPFASDETQKLLAEYDLVILIGGPFFEDVWYAAALPFPATTKVLQLENCVARLSQNLAIGIGVYGELQGLVRAIVNGIEQARYDKASAVARNQELAQQASTRLPKAFPENDATPLTAAQVLNEIANLTPSETIIVDESITAFSEVVKQFDLKRPGQYFAGRGGGIGQGIAGALGVQIANPNQRVMLVSGDGSAMYSIQALWTAAHHDLPIVFVILSNREYRVLKHNLDTYRRRFDIVSTKPYPHMDLGEPNLDFVAMANGMGVAGTQVRTVASLREAIATAFESKAPYVLDVVVAGHET